MKYQLVMQFTSTVTNQNGIEGVLECKVHNKNNNHGEICSPCWKTPEIKQRIITDKIIRRKIGFQVAPKNERQKTTIE